MYEREPIALREIDKSNISCPGCGGAGHYTMECGNGGRPQHRVESASLWSDKCLRPPSGIRHYTTIKEECRGGGMSGKLGPPVDSATATYPKEEGESSFI